MRVFPLGPKYPNPYPNDRSEKDLPSLESSLDITEVGIYKKGFISLFVASYNKARVFDDVEEALRERTRLIGCEVADCGTLPPCNPSGIPLTSHWTCAAIIVQYPLDEESHRHATENLVQADARLFGRATSTMVDLKLVSQMEFGLGAVAMRYKPRRWKPS